MRRVLGISTALVFYGFISSRGTVINVPGDCPTIQAGIDSCQTGDTVLVQPGTYVENINFNGTNLVLGSSYLTTGDTAFISTTIIDGDSAGPVVTFENGEDSTALIKGFTIQNGYADYGGGIYIGALNPKVIGNRIIGNLAFYDGGGICCYGANPTISNNVISGNSSIEYSGGGIYCAGSYPVISNNTISGNSNCGISCIAADAMILNNTIMGNSGGAGGGIYCAASNATINGNTISMNSAIVYDGGAISCRGSSPTINNNTISGNSSIYVGGGISCLDSSNPMIVNNLITNNSAPSGGGIDSRSLSNPTISFNTIIDNSAINAGGIACNNSGPTISNNLIFRNSASNSGGGIICYNSSDPVITNNTFSKNSAYVGGAIYSSNSNPSIINSILWSDSAATDSEIFAYNSSLLITYCDIQDTLWPGAGNITCDPMFCFPDTGNLYLADTSCCVGAGQAGVDIGAFGVGCCGYVVGDVNGSDNYNGLDITYGVAYLKGGNFPACSNCAACPDWYHCGDVNGSCNYNGLDITFGVEYLKMNPQFPELIPCPDCPPTD